MDKIFSTRIDETAAHRLTFLAKQLKTSKKDIQERALAQFAQGLEEASEMDELTQTFGAWEREETPDDIRGNIRREFQSSMNRQ